MKIQFSARLKFPRPAENLTRPAIKKWLIFTLIQDSIMIENYFADEIEIDRGIARNSIYGTDISCNKLWGISALFLIIRDKRITNTEKWYNKTVLNIIPDIKNRWNYLWKGNFVRKWPYFGLKLSLFAVNMNTTC